MFKLIKWLFFLAVIIVIGLVVTGHKIGGKTITEHFKTIAGRGSYNESIQDIRALLGEAIKAVGETISPEVTSSERKELENVIKNELQKAGEAPAKNGGK